MKNDINNRIDRIRIMEGYLDRSAEAISDLRRALDRYEAVQAEYRELEEYYSSPDWRRDFEADEAGLLPEELKRGVLSEDAVFDLITEHNELTEKIKRIINCLSE